MQEKSIPGLGQKGEPSQLSAEEQEAKAMDFFRFIGHEELGERPMTFVKDGQQVTIQGREFWKYCGNIVGPMVEFVRNLGDADPQKTTHMFTLEATALAWAGTGSATEQPSHNEQ